MRRYFVDFHRFWGTPVPVGTFLRPFGSSPEHVGGTIKSAIGRAITFPKRNPLWYQANFVIAV